MLPLNLEFLARNTRFLFAFSDAMCHAHLGYSELGSVDEPSTVAQSKGKHNVIFRKCRTPATFNHHGFCGIAPRKSGLACQWKMEIMVLPALGICLIQGQLQAGLPILLDSSSFNIHPMISIGFAHQL